VGKNLVHKANLVSDVLVEKLPVGQAYILSKKEEDEVQQT